MANVWVYYYKSFLLFLKNIFKTNLLVIKSQSQCFCSCFCWSSTWFTGTSVPSTGFTNIHMNLFFTTQKGTKASDRAQQAKKKVEVAQYAKGTVHAITK